MIIPLHNVGSILDDLLILFLLNCGEVERASSVDDLVLFLAFALSINEVVCITGNLDVPARDSI